MRYRHTQVGWTVLAVTGTILLWIVLVPHSGVPPAVAALLVAVLVLFSSLTVTIDAERIEIRYGPGIIRFRVALVDIASCRTVRNPWLAGWGIRWIGSGWLLNVSGLDAVELALKNGKILRIGTDEPDRLCTAIQQAMA